MLEMFGWWVLYIVVMALYLCEVTTQWFFFTTLFSSSFSLVKEFKVGGNKERRPLRCSLLETG